MPFISKIVSFWNNLFRRRQLELDLNDELNAWVDEMAERMIQTGYAPETAREAALRELGGIERIKSLVREQRIGFRNLRRTGVTAAVAVIAFVSGAGVSAGFRNRKGPAPVAPPTAMTLERAASKSLPVLEGRLVDNAGKPIPFVEIGIKEYPVRRYTYTDESGNFSFINPPQNPYGLEAGKHYWQVNSLGFAFRPFPPSDSFMTLGPREMSIKDKSGQPSDGEILGIKGGLTFGVAPATQRIELRQFRYDSSVVELRADNIPPGKIDR